MQFLRKFDIYATGNLGLPVVFLLFRKKEVVRMRRFLIGLCILVGGVYACQRVDNESVWGVSQMQISRLEKSALEKIRDKMAVGSEL